MSELAAIATVLGSICEVAESGGLARKYWDVRANALRQPNTGLREPKKRTEVFTGVTGTGAAGISSSVTALRGDDGLVAWNVVVWVENWESTGWAATVQGEVAVADESGMLETVFIVKRVVHNVPEMVAAVDECAELAVAFPLQ